MKITHQGQLQILAPLNGFVCHETRRYLIHPLWPKKSLFAIQIWKRCRGMCVWLQAELDKISLDKVRNKAPGPAILHHKEIFS